VNAQQIIESVAGWLVVIAFTLLLAAVYLIWLLSYRRPAAAHALGNLAELVCSNSLGSGLPDRAPRLLKTELRRMNSLLNSTTNP
jgi:folate-dependent tRNA-U54 methylase TrmFO/GidA